MVPKKDRNSQTDGSGPGSESKSDGGEVPFDTRLERLEGIVRDLESGGLGLERSIERYQEGIELLKGCHNTLESYRARVEELGREAESVLTPLADDPDFASGSSFSGSSGSGATDSGSSGEARRSR